MYNDDDDDGVCACMCLQSERECRSVLSDSLRPHGRYSPWDSPGKNTGVGCHALLQGIFPNQGSRSLMSPNWRVDCLPLAPAGKSKQS